MRKKRLAITYIAADYFSAVLSWTFFYIFRKVILESAVFGYNVPISFDKNYIYGLLAVPVFWVFLYYLQGSYKQVYRRSRLKDLGGTFVITIIGVVILFFALMLDDYVKSFTNYYSSLAFFILIHYLITYIFRFFITSSIKHKIARKEIQFNTLIIGDRDNALKLYKSIVNVPFTQGYNILGYIKIDKNEIENDVGDFKCVGDENSLQEVVEKNNVEEIILTLEPYDQARIENMLYKIEGNKKIKIKAIPYGYDIRSGKVRINSLYDEPLIEISHEVLPQWEANMKRFIDVTISLFVIIVFFPLFLIIAIGVKIDSKGTVFYSHERIGKGRKPFNIFKFRTMFPGSEKYGPALAQEQDKRVTSFGRILRKWRLDELPQFFNIFRGDISIVGPRALIPEELNLYEKKHTILSVKSGLTGLAQVSGMRDISFEERRKLDTYYVQNWSFWLDLTILVKTIKTVIRGAFNG